MRGVPHAAAIHRRWLQRAHAGRVCVDSFQADRGPTGAIGSTLVTPQLNGLWARSKRGFFHDGRFPTLLDVADHYNACFNLL
jgi:hypothetical protein